MKKLALLFYFIAHTGMAQLPVEVLVGSKRTTLDILFFRPIKNAQAEPSPWLFFNRNRAAYDYATQQSSFGFTEAISYNPAPWKGFAPVGVIQWGATRPISKVGVQKVISKENLLAFSWLVLEVKKAPRVDYFLLVRWTPAISEQIKLFSQLEWIQSFPTSSSDIPIQWIQRGRLGIKYEFIQVGLGVDMSQVSRTRGTNFQNWGGFLRYEF